MIMTDVYVPMPMPMQMQMQMHMQRPPPLMPLYLSVAARDCMDRRPDSDSPTTAATATATNSNGTDNNNNENKRRSNYNTESDGAMVSDAAVELTDEIEDDNADLVALIGSVSSTSLASTEVVNMNCDSNPNASTSASTPASTLASASASASASTLEKVKGRKQNSYQRKSSRNTTENSDSCSNASRASTLNGKSGQGSRSGKSNKNVMDSRQQQQQRYGHGLGGLHATTTMGMVPQHGGNIAFSPNPNHYPHPGTMYPFMVYVAPPPPPSHVAHGLYEVAPHHHHHPPPPLYLNCNEMAAAPPTPMLSMAPDYLSLSMSPPYFSMESSPTLSSLAPDSPFLTRAAMPPPPPPPPQAPKQRGIKLVAIDVECAKNGYGHLDLVPCRIAMVDEEGRTLFDEFVRITDVKLPMTEFTGLTLQQIETQGRPLSEVLTKFHSMLREYHTRHEGGVWIVGQSLCLDVVWTALQRGVHYTGIIDIAHIFKTPRPGGEIDQWTFYSLRNTAWHALGATMNAHYHSPVEDAEMSMQLYQKICCKPDELFRHRQNLMKMAQNSALKYSRYDKLPLVGEWQGNCSAAFGGFCICGQQVLPADRDVDDEHCLAVIRALYAEKTVVKQPIKFPSPTAADVVAATPYKHERQNHHLENAPHQSYMYPPCTSVLS